MKITVNDFLNLFITDKINKNITERGIKCELILNNGKNIVGIVNTVPLYFKKSGRTQLGVPVKPGIYLIREKSTFRFYVGSTSDLCHRRATHIRGLRNNSHFNQNLNIAFKENGISQYEFHYFFLNEINESFRKILYDIEQEILNNYYGTDMCFNIGSDVRAATKGKTISEITRKALSLRMTGVKKSKETRMRMSLAQKIYSKVHLPHIQKKRNEIISRPVYINGKAYKSVDDFCRQHKMTGRTIRLRIASQDLKWINWNYVDQLWNI